MRGENGATIAIFSVLGKHYEVGNYNKVTRPWPCHLPYSESAVAVTNATVELVAPNRLSVSQGRGGNGQMLGPFFFGLEGAIASTATDWLVSPENG